MAKEDIQQRVHKEFKSFLNQVYPGTPMPKATQLLVQDLWDDIMNGKRIGKKFKKMFR